MKKFVSLVIVIILCTMLFGCSKDEDVSRNGIVVTTSLEGKTPLVGNNITDFPLSTRGESLAIMGCSDVDQENVFVWQKYEQMTGVNVNWTTVSRSIRAEEVYKALTNRQNLDLILRCKISASTLTQYGESNLILDLTENNLLQTYAPNCWAYLQSHPVALASITDPDGSIYSLPQINSGAELRVSRKIYVNKNWLANVDMELPSTTEEFYELLTAFKEQDANGNGNTEDEIPLCSIDWQSIQEAFYGSFGLANRGLHNMTVDYDEETGGIRYIEASDDYKAFLEYFNRLYSEGLMDRYVFTKTLAEWYNAASNDTVGVFISTNLASLPADKVDDWVAIEEALSGPNGDKMFTAVRADFHSTGAAVIPSTCSNPALVLQWLDYFWTDEGTLFYHMGIEGETFEVLEDGSYDYMQYIYDEMATENKSFDDVLKQYTPYPGGSNPTVEIAPYFKGGEMADVPAAAALKLIAYGPDEYWPSFTFTTEENEALRQLNTDISKYVETKQIEFISGTVAFTEWDGYLAQLDELDMDEIIAIYQAAVDRYYDD